MARRHPTRLTRGVLIGCMAAGAVLGVAFAAGPARSAQKQGVLTGTVSDRQGKPVAGALVRVNRWDGFVVGDKWAMFKGVRTDERGRFTMPIRYHGRTMKLKEVWADKKGCVRDVRGGSFVLNGRQEITLDFRIGPGKVLAGTVSWPLSGAERLSGVTEKTRRILLVVKGKAYQSTHVAGKGGAFEIWVPHGVYSIEVFLGSRRIKREGIQSPARDILIQPTRAALTPQVLGKAFDELWASVDRHYSYFFLKKVDWPALRRTYRPKAVAAGDVKAFAAVLTEMLAHLNDPHVWIDSDGQITPTIMSRYTQNWNARAIRGILETKTSCGRFAVVGKTRGDGFGYLLISRQTAADADSVAKTVRAVRALRDAPGFLVDLRVGANGGNEELASQVARLFCARDVPYATHKYRSGPGHDEFGPVRRRVLKASKEAFTKPVVCLIGSRCTSSGEAFVLMMKALGHVTTVGERTRGASGNPKPVELPGVGLAVWFPRWVAMTPDGTCFEGRGIAPDVEVKRPLAAYVLKDPTLAKALAVLREKVRGAKK